MTPPVDVGEGLVVEREAAEENLGALITTNFLVISSLVKRRVFHRLLNLGEEGGGAALDACGESFGYDVTDKAIKVTQLKVIIGVTYPQLEAAFIKQSLKLVAQTLEITGRLSITLTLDNLFQECLKVVDTFTALFATNNLLQRLKHLFEFTSDVTFKPRLSLYLIPNIPNQIRKPLRHLTCAHALPKSSNHLSNILLICITNTINHQKALEEADDEVQHGVADLILCDISGTNAATGDYGSVITKRATFIPNELLESLGQFRNKLSTIQSTHYLLKLRSKPGSRAFNFLKKSLNFLGELRGTIWTTAPILPRHPEDPVNGLLQVGRAVKEEAYQGG
ncbi:HD domain-containing protein [Babesia caballi]|uniref:HD domain-containing protein n=1 Tax=Babesia caballi TaxID=5871 RepID=A0AAV4LUF0_BABCB|nr:HD domain-containing protein [Babesia caballi]